MHLMVVIEDRISEWAAKGEVLEGYFNPAAAFSDITVLSLVADAPDRTVVETLCAPANPRFHSVDINRRELVLRTAGLRPGRLKSYLGKALSPLGHDRPDVIRAYGDGLAAAAASVVAARDGVPFLVSLHTTPDPNIQARFFGWRDRFWRRCLAASVADALRASDALMAVYAPILDFLPPDLARKTRVVPNVVDVPSRPPRRIPDRRPLKALWVSRQMPGRDPRPVIAALQSLNEVELTLVGDGPLHAAAIRTAHMHDVETRVRFVRAVANHELCQTLPDYDVLVTQSDFRETPKSVMEAALSGLPVIVNRHPAEASKEYADLPVILVDGGAESYAAALRDLARDDGLRQRLSQQTEEAAWRIWDPTASGRAAAQLLISLTSPSADTISSPSSG